MPRRFALALLWLLVLLFSALLFGRAFLKRKPSQAPAVPSRRPTPPIPPTPIPAQRVLLYFESPEDERFHPEPRDIPASVDKVTLLRAIAVAVLAGPKHPELLAPLPEGWTVRAAFLLKDGLAVVDLAPPVPPAEENAEPPPVSLLPNATRWQTGTHEEESAIQSLLLSVSKNLPEIARIVLLVGGEPVETLAGHIDLTHPLRADPERADDLPLFEPPEPTPTPSAETAPEEGNGSAEESPAAAEESPAKTVEAPPEPTRPEKRATPVPKVRAPEGPTPTPAPPVAPRKLLPTRTQRSESV